MRRTWCRRPISGPTRVSSVSAATPSSRRGCTASPPTAPPPSWAAPKHRHDELLETGPADARPSATPWPGPRPALRDRLDGALATSRPGSAPWSSCATSTTCPTSRSPPSSASPSRPPRCACTVPAASSGSSSSRAAGDEEDARAVLTSRLRRLAERSPAADDTRRARPRAGATSRRACAARPSWRSTASCCEALRTLRTEVLEPAPGLLRRHPRGARGRGRAPRHPLDASRGRRVAYVGGIAAATARRRRRRDRARAAARPPAEPVRRRPRRAADDSPTGLAGTTAIVVRPHRAPRAVAQLVEHRSPKPKVGGSSPSCPAPPRTLPLGSPPWR